MTATGKPTSRGLQEVDWSKLPAPEDDGAARHLAGLALPPVALPSTAGSDVVLANLPGRTVVFAYPMTGTPGVALPDGWDLIPGARGCTPHACAFRDLFADLSQAGAAQVFGLSTQKAEAQREAAERLHLPFPLLSDAGLKLAEALSLPTMVVDGRTMIKRLALIVDSGRIAHVFYPVFPPDRNAADVLAWLEANPA
jgi:peroxiredoxin